jgi:hypothetical protein
MMPTFRRHLMRPDLTLASVRTKINPFYLFCYKFPFVSRMRRDNALILLIRQCFLGQIEPRAIIGTSDD